MEAGAWRTQSGGRCAPTINYLSQSVKSVDEILSAIAKLELGGPSGDAPRADKQGLNTYIVSDDTISY